MWYKILPETLSLEMRRKKWLELFHSAETLDIDNSTLDHVEDAEESNADRKWNTRSYKWGKGGKATRSIRDQHIGRFIQNELDTCEKRLECGEDGCEVGLADLATSGNGSNRVEKIQLEVTSIEVEKHIFTCKITRTLDITLSVNKHDRAEAIPV